MKLTFLGTRGGIQPRSPLHYMHSVLLIEFRHNAILIDWGADWLGHKPPKVDGLLITHAHNDHIGGLADGFPAPVFCMPETVAALEKYPLDLINVKPLKPFYIGNFIIESFPVLHSVIAPATGYRIRAGKRVIFYVSDLVSIVNTKEALTGVDVYIGDGALITRRMLVRKKQGTLVGHSPIKDQLSWCAKYGVPRMLITHCGSEITKGDESVIVDRIEMLANEYDVKTLVAYDGMVYNI